MSFLDLPSEEDITKMLEEQKRLEDLYNESQKFRKINEKAKEEAIKRLLITYHKQKIDKGEYDYIPCVKEAREHLEKSKEAETQVLFITINPMPAITLKDIKKTIEKLLSKKWIENAIYVYEQRGTTTEDAGRGTHIHILLYKGDKRYSQFHREFSNTLKNICDVSNSHIFNVLPCLERDIPKRLNYMLGDKKELRGDHKKEKQEMDQIWRTREGLEKYYVKGEIIFWHNYNNGSIQQTQNDNTQDLQEEEVITDDSP